MLNIKRRRVKSPRLAIQRTLTAEFDLIAARNPVPPLPKAYNPTGINPAQLTFAEYYKAVNSKGKWHPSDSYQATIKSLNFDHAGSRYSDSKKETYQRLIQRKILKGIMFEFRLKLEDRKYGVQKINTNDPNGFEWKRDENGDYLSLTPEQIRERGYREHTFTIAAFNPEGFCVGRVQDEWGAMLVWVADEYKGVGLGPLLTKYARQFEPDKDSGGFTTAGGENLRRVHREWVRDALTQGLYRKWIAEGILTKEKVDEIINQAELSIKVKNTENLGSGNPKEWMLYSEFDHGAFILYDRKFKDLYNTTERNMHWAETMIKGAITVYDLSDPHPRAGIVNLFGADSIKIGRFLYRLAASYCLALKIPFYVDPQDMKYISEDEYVIGGSDTSTGYKRFVVRIKKPVPEIDRLGIVEKQWRQTFDKYDETLNGILETAHSKYRYHTNEMAAMDQRTLTAAVSFRSNRDLMKRYGAMFNKMTLGFEVEVSGGNPGQVLDEAEEKAEFLDNFDSYTKNNYFSNQYGSSASELSERFEITPKYGVPDQAYRQKFINYIQPIARDNFRVIKMKMVDGSVLMESVHVDSFTARHFIDSDREFDTAFVIQKTRETMDKMLEAVTALPIVPSERFAQVRLALEGYPLLTVLVKQLEDKRDANFTDLDLRHTVYKIALAVHRFIQGYEQIFNIIKDEGNGTTRMAVFDDRGYLEIVDFASYKISGGVLSPSLQWSDEGKEYFEEEYEEAKKEAAESAWQDHWEYLQDQGQDEDEVINKVYDLVVDNVDPDAERSEDYHGEKELRGKVTIVEPDSSISPPGAEIVSPVHNGINAGMEWLTSVFDMIQTHGLETNSSTGLHVNIGTFNSLSQPENEGNHPTIDVLKLAVLSGDTYLLKQFDRVGNQYAKTIEHNLVQLSNSGFDFALSRKTDLWATLRRLNKVLIVQQSDRYRTINMQNLLDSKYLEFRIAGGQNYHRDEKKVLKAVLRYMQLCAIACDPQAYFKEYITELYKLFVGSKLLDTTKGFQKPRPKNPIEASYVLRQWSSDQYTNGRDGLSRDALKIMKDALADNANLREDQVLDIIAGLNVDNYKSVTNNVLYALRLLMLYTARQQNNPKQYLRDVFQKHLPAIKSHVAPKLYRNKPGWVRFFYTGQMTNQEMTAMTEIPRISKKYSSFISNYRS